MGIHSWITKTFLYDIREPRCKEIKMGYHIWNGWILVNLNVLKSDVPYCFTFISAPLYWKKWVWTFRFLLSMSSLKLFNIQTFWNLIPHFTLLRSRLPNIIQKSFCTPDEAIDPAFPMNYVPAFYHVCSQRNQAKTAANFFRHPVAYQTKQHF